MIKEVWKEDILKNGYLYRKDLFGVEYSAHALNRIKERTNGSLLLYPKLIRITEDNLVKGLLSNDGRYLFKVIIKLEFKKNLDIYLVIIPSLQFCKTVYFKKQNNGNTNKIR